MILWDEIGRAGGGAVLWQLGVNSMALPPVIDYGSDYLKDLVVRSVRSLVLLESTENITHLHLNIGTRRGYGKEKHVTCDFGTHGWVCCCLSVSPDKTLGKHY